MKRLKLVGFFKSLMLLSCIIGILPLLLLGYLSFQKSSAILQDELTSSNKLILQQNKEKLESLLKTIDTLTTLTISGPVTTNSISMQTVLDLPYDYTSRAIFEKLVYTLVQIQVFELGIQDVNLISYRQNWIVESGAIFPMKNRDVLDPHDIYLDKLYKELLTYRDDSRRSYWALIKDEDSGYILKLIKHIPLNASNPYGIITVNVPLHELGKHINGDPSSGQTLIVDANGSILASLTNNLAGTSVRDEAYYQQMMENDRQEDYFIYEIDGEKQLVQYNRSQYNDWSYVSVTPLASLMSKSDDIKLYTIISVAILIILVVATAFFSSHRLYLPIARIYRFIQPEQKVTTQNELHDIGEHLIELTHSRTMLHSQITHLHKQTREFFVFKLLLGDVKHSAVEEQLEKHHLPSHWNQWCVLAIQIDTLEDTHYSETDIELMLYAMHNIIEETVPPYMRLIPIIQNQGLALILGGTHEDTTPFKVQVYNKAEEIRSRVKQYLKLKISIGISRVHKDWIYASLAYHESLDALSYRVRLGSETILLIDEVEPSSEQSFRYPKEMELKLMEAIKYAQFEQADESLQDIVNKFFEYPMNHYDYQQFLGRLFNNLTGLVQDAGEPVQEVFDKEIFSAEILTKMHTSNQIKAWFWTYIIEPLLAWTGERLQKQEVNISKFIISEIEQNYDQELSIEMFAARLHYHPSYISRVFKKDIGINFSEYLSNYRIEIAKQLLRDTNMKIADIAEKLQYSTASNFNRIFKKVVQITPSQYRDQFK